MYALQFILYLLRTRTTHGLVCVYDRLHIDLYEKCINEYKLKNNALFNKVFFFIWFDLKKAYVMKTLVPFE